MWKAAVGVKGCRNSHIKEPAAFAALADRWDKTLTPAGGYSFGAITNFAKYPFGDEDAKYANPVSHSKGGNYLFADGHAVWMPWQDVKGRMFSINSCFADNYTLRTIP